MSHRDYPAKSRCGALSGLQFVVLRATQGGAALCPGLVCLAPSGQVIRCTLWLGLIGLCALIPLPAVAQQVPARERLLDQAPFDQITLTEDNDGAVLKVAPLDLPDRRLPQDPAADDTLRIRLLDRPGEQFDVAWYSIAEVKLYEQMLLEEAKQFAAEEEFTQAFENYASLLERHPQTPGLNEAIDEFLLKNAVAAFRAKNYDNAYVQLLQLHERDPQHPMLSKALDSVADKLISQWVQAEQYAAARGVIQLLGERFEPEQLPTLGVWRQRFESKASQLDGQARSAFDAQQFNVARRLNRQALAIWPTHPTARDLAEQINRQAPQVVVGVSRLGGGLTDRLDDWSSLRRRRLVRRTLSEQIGVGAAGGVYQCPVGEFESDPLSRQFAIQLRSEIPWSTGEGAITGYDVSRLLLQMAAPGSPNYRADWADLLASVQVQDVYRVVVDLARPHPRPQALLQVAFSPAGSNPDSENAPTFGAYRIDTQTADEVRYHPTASAAESGPQEIIERRVVDVQQAVSALRGGELTVLDRVPPWLLGELRSDRRLVVEPYALPRVHVLIPNPRRPLLQNRTFRRALVYGLHREMILQQELLAGSRVEGAAVLSGPFPERTSFEDTLGYASDPQLEPRPYEPRMAFALVRAALNELAAANKAEQQAAGAAPADEAGPALEEVPPLVLAHGASFTARAACEAIQAHWSRIGVTVSLIEWNPGDAGATADEYDLLYAPLAMWDPLVDARRLLGEGGMVGRGTPYLTLALRRLDEAVDSTEIRQRLQEIHRLVYDDLTVIPLWQLPEHFAYSRNLQQVGERPLSLYQNVERWRISLRPEAP